MNQHKRMKRISERCYLASKHKWSMTLWRQDGTLIQIKNVDGSGRVRVPNGWYVSFFMTAEKLAEAAR